MKRRISRPKGEVGRGWVRVLRMAAMVWIRPTVEGPQMLMGPAPGRESSDEESR